MLNLFQQYLQIQAQNSSSKSLDFFIHCSARMQSARGARMFASIADTHAFSQCSIVSQRCIYYGWRYILYTVSACKCCFWSLWIVNTDKKQHWIAINMMFKQNNEMVGGHCHCWRVWIHLPFHRFKGFGCGDINIEWNNLGPWGIRWWWEWMGCWISNSWYTIPKYLTVCPLNTILARVLVVSFTECRNFWFQRKWMRSGRLRSQKDGGGPHQGAYHLVGPHPMIFKRFFKNHWSVAWKITRTSGCSCPPPEKKNIISYKVHLQMLPFICVHLKCSYTSLYCLKYRK